MFDFVNLKTAAWNPMDSRAFFRRKQGDSADCRAGRRRYMSIGTIILIILVIALLGGFSGIGGGPSTAPVIMAAAALASSSSSW